MTLGETIGSSGGVEGAGPPACLSLDSLRDRFRRYSYRPMVDEAAIKAAVLVPFYQLGSELHIILTKRTTLVTLQQGHIAFPGGGREAGDNDLLATALRESSEEIGLDPQRVDVLGRIDDFFTHNGQMFVAGFVGLIDPLASPYRWVLQEREVAEMLEVPVPHLLDPGNVLVAEPRQVNGRMWPNETFLFGGHRVFGATARALRNVLDIAFTGV